MQGLSSQEKRDTLDSFSAYEESPRLLFDRTTLERWGTCPAQAAIIESGKVNNQELITVAGSEIHEALGRSLRLWVESNGALSPSELAEAVEDELRLARPDVQPQVFAGMKASIWSWVRFVQSVHPSNFIRFDGGEGIGKSGQLAWDWDEHIRLTSELDVLYAGPSPELLHEVDYKTGHAIIGAADVAESFQFAFHAYLVFQNYEKVNGLEVTIWNTRSNIRSYRVTFDRRQLPAITARIHGAIASYHQNSHDPQPWPAWDKCSVCRAAALCPAAGQDIGDVAGDPPAALRTLIATEAKADQWKKALTAYVDSTGQDVVVDGVAFGRNKPRSERKPAAAIYQLKGESNGDSDK